MIYLTCQYQNPGEERQNTTIEIHKQLAFYYSPVIHRKLSKEVQWNGPKDTFDLDCELPVAILFIEFLHRDRLRPVAKNLNDRQLLVSAKHAVHLWALAAYHTMPRLQNQAIDMLDQSTPATSPEILKQLWQEEREYIWDNTGEETDFMLRKFFLDWWCRRCIVEDLAALVHEKTNKKVHWAIVCYCGANMVAGMVREPSIAYHVSTIVVGWESDDDHVAYGSFQGRVAPGYLVPDPKSVFLL